MFNKIKGFFIKSGEALKTIDFMGPEFEFEDDNSSKFKSVSGFCFSVSCIIICVTIGSLFGNEIFERKEPMVNISQQFITYSDVYLDSFPIMFSFKDKFGKGLKLNELNNFIETMIYSEQMNSNGVVNDVNDYYNFIECKNINYKLYNDIFKKFLIKDNEEEYYFCLDQKQTNLYFSNSYLALNSTNFNFVFKKCQNNCDNKMEEILEDMLLTIIYPTSFVDIYNYTNPVLTYFEETTTKLSNFLTRRSYMRFIYNVFIADNGLINSDISSEDFISLDSVVPDDLLHIKEGPKKNVLFWLALESPKVKKLFNRK